MSRRLSAFTILVLLLALAVAAPGRAAVRSYDAKAFAAAQTAGKSIVVHVHATW